VIAVHHDDRRCALGPVDALRIDPPWPIEWGHGSQLAAIRRCLGWLHERADFDWLVLLSGQDYPIRPVAEIERSLAAADVDAFLQIGPVARGRDEFARRYRYRYRRVSGRVAAVAARLDPLVSARRLPSGTYLGLPARPPLPAYHGSDWFTLSRRAVEAVLAAPGAVTEHFLHTIVPTEAYVHTILANDPSLRLANDSRRFAEFEPGSPNPRVLGYDDVDAALASGQDFARKFEDLGVLDEIDRHLISPP
jgi:hypothetical protein